MKIKDLIEELKAFDPETLVVTRGFDEGGFADIAQPKMVSVRNRKTKSAREIFGEYEETERRGQTALLIDHTT